MSPPTPPPPEMTRADRQSLLAAARQARSRAYAPYSRFTVGAAVLTCDGNLYPGCNVELAQDSGCCAEGVAVANALTHGALRQGQSFIRAVAVSTALQGNSRGSPCGICRQVLHDFSTPTACQVVLDDGGDGEVHTLADLLPYGFRLPVPEASLAQAADLIALEAWAQRDPTPDTLAQVATRIRPHAAAHSRGQPEGAVILTTDGHAFCGVSVENSNANHYTRALAVAIYRAVLAGQTGRFVRGLALCSNNATINPAFSNEFLRPDVRPLFTTPAASAPTESAPTRPD